MLSLSPRRARADQWSARPVNLVVPFAAGGTTDILARVVAARISEEFLKYKDGIARLRKLGAEPAGGSPEDIQRYALAETGKSGKVAKFAGIKPE